MADTQSKSASIRPARAPDLEPVKRLAAACKLPADGIEDSFGANYAVVECDSDVFGVAGVERYGRHGLLRTVAVSPTRRGWGWGSALVDDRIAWARSVGIESLYLLTTSAEGYFARRGFVVEVRANAPAEIRASKEFASACPDTATLMRYALR